MLDETQWKNLCLLARLDPEDAGLSGLMDDFNKILSYVKTIQKADTSSVEDAYTKDDTQDTLRSDEPGPVLSPQEIASFAPAWESGHFVVPAVIDAES